ncbi:MAG: long-chain fatty acid--CoA ligase [Nevskia sp.]|nr:long-chain fatty acid--CoA ligase [Nevskia sp.]
MNSYDPIVRTPSAYNFQLLIKQLLITPVARASRNEIVYRDQLRFGYPTLIERISRLAGVLTGLGAKPGQTIAVMDWDSHRYLESYFAIPMFGCVLQTANVRLSPEQLLYTLNHAGASIILVNAEFLPLLESLYDKLETAKTFILIDEAGAQPKSPIPFSGEYEQLLAQAASSYDFPEFDENTRATTFYTSGTTGLPKGVYYSHRQIVLNTLATLATFGTNAAQGRLHNEDVYMPITPLFHVHGWGMPYAATLLGIKQVYPGRYVPDMLIKLIRDEEVTFTHGVPTVLHMLMNCPQAAQTDLSKLKMLVGGSALPKGLAKIALSRGIDLTIGYGMSETGPIQVTNQLHSSELGGDLDRQAELRTRPGRPALMCDVQIVDEQMNLLPHDGESTGEIVFRSAWTTQGYFKNAETSEQLWKGGWMHSGDIGSFGADGVLHISDRVKDVIKTGGEWVSSLDIEDLISQHPAVSECAVIAVKCPRWGERPLALVVPHHEHKGKIDAAAIRAHLQTYADQGVISKYGVPDTVKFVDALEKTSVGKLDKKLLRTKHQ